MPLRKTQELDASADYDIRVYYKLQLVKFDVWIRGGVTIMDSRLLEI